MLLVGQEQWLVVVGRWVEVGFVILRVFGREVMVGDVLVGGRSCSMVLKSVSVFASISFFFPMLAKGIANLAGSSSSRFNLYLLAIGILCQVCS